MCHTSTVLEISFYNMFSIIGCVKQGVNVHGEELSFHRRFKGNLNLRKH